MIKQDPRKIYRPLSFSWKNEITNFDVINKQNIMFVLAIPEKYVPLALNDFNTMEEKLNKAFAHYKISVIYCQVENRWDMKIPPDPNTILPVKYTCIPGGESSFTRSVLNEHLAFLKSELNDFVYEDLDHETIKESLHKFKIISTENFKENDTTNRLKFPGVDFKVMVWENWQIIPEYHLNISQNAMAEINEQFELRKIFYKEITDHLDTLIAFHEKPTDSDKHTYVWDSENATFEIAQLVEVIKQTRLKSNPEIKINYSKFYRDFYRFFGLSDKNHHQKLNDIRKKENHRSYLHDFAKYIDATAIGEKNGPEKKQP